MPIADVVGGRGGIPAAIPTDAPGTRFCYSNPGYALIELLIEDLTGEPFAAWTARRILAPLGMSNSSFDPTPQPGDAAPHRRSRHRMPDGFYSQRAPGGLRTTAQDLVTLASAMTDAHPLGRGGGALPERLVEETWRSPKAATGAFRLREGGYALGLISTTLPDGFRLVANQGSRPGWRALLAVRPDRQQAIAITTNSDTGNLLLAGIALEWLRRVHGQPLSLHRRVVRLT